MREVICTAFVDSHAHLRQGQLMRLVVPWTARSFARCLAMPNLRPPLTSGTDALRNRDEIQAIAPRLDVIPAIYLTAETTPAMIHQAVGIGVRAAKLYLRGPVSPGTTNADSALLVDDVPKLRAVFKAMRDTGMVLCLHMELPFGPYGTREILGMSVYQTIREVVADLLIVVEHISKPLTFQALKDDPHTAFTITPHHLWNTADDARGNHHLHCMPVLKDEEDRLGLCTIATSGHPRVFAGTDTAPHDIGQKDRAERPAAGVFCAIAAVDCYASVFEDAMALEDGRFEAFMSLNGPHFYGQEPPARKARLWEIEIGSETIPERISDGMLVVVPFRHGEPIRWKVEMLDN